ncbi:hypothetical protein JDV02_009569 [Purpureocillium takamizusanense]|uniref:MARVEL domain-containing protein n=1 Tax=Purpureocillium takamizusanense TaxID=2060973 RepID=A0A9Q8QM98_9HYPO|nr:uncharacterized protein JDV02_009569 [Purpureocillium takamizusanense]UNI23769.1 hypothetical protein JDV02_009569 [Purpureocillium takamizusanense]
MAPETSTQTDTRAEAVSPVTSTATSTPPLSLPLPHQQQQQQPAHDHFAPAMPPKAAAQQQPYVMYPSSYGEHYVPYEQSRQADMLHQGAAAAQVVAPRIIVPETKSWRITKDVMHVLAMVISIAGIGIGISIARDSYSGLLGTLVSVPIFGVALIWSLAEMITRATTHWGPGIHPGAHVGVCLILWIAAVIAGGCCATVVGIADADCDSSYRSSYRYYDESCYYGRTRGRFLGLAILLLVLFVAEFVLFVGGCIDTHKRNKARAGAPVMIVAQPGMYPQAMMQQQQQQQQQQHPPQQPMSQQYFAPPQAYHPQQQYVAVPPPAEAPADHARTAPQDSEHARGKQPQGAQPGITEFYSPSGPGQAV